MAVGYVASASSGSQASVATFNIGTLGTGARAGIVFVAIHNSGTDIITGVTWNGTSMNLLYKATDTDTEPGVVKAYFLDNVTNGVITVSRTNNTVVTVGYAASISAASACIVTQTITRVSSTQNTNANTSTTGTGASGEVAVTDDSPGSSSMRFAAAYTGAPSPVLAGTNSTLLQSLDSTALGSSFVRETTAGQGSRNVGFATGTTDDWAMVAVAVSEAAPQNPQPTAASATLTGSTPTVTVAAPPVVALPTAASLVLTPSTPAVKTPVVVQPPAAGGASYSAAVLSDNPAGYWRLGEASGNAVDSSSGGTNTGTPTGTLTRDVVGALTVGDDGAVTFGGGRFDVADHASLDFGNTFSIEFWLKLSASGSYIMSKGNQFNVTLTSNLIGLDNDDVGTAFRSQTALNDSNWHHIVITHNGTGSGNTVIYKDGSPDGLTEVAPTLSFTSNATGLTIGSYGSGTAPYSGGLDEVAVYSTILSSARVSAHYAAATGTGGLVLAGATPTVVVNTPISPTAASMALTAATPAVVVGANQTALPSAASLTLTGATPAVATPSVALPTAAALTLTASTPAVATPILSLPTAAALTLTGTTPAVKTPVVGLPTAASLALAGATPAVATPVASLPAAASMALTASTPTVTVTTVDNVTSLPAAAAMTLTGATPAVATPVVVQPTAAALALAFGTPDVKMPVAVVPGPLGLTLTGSTPDVLAPRVVVPGPLGLTLTGGTPAVTASANVLALPDAASLTLTGAVPLISGGVTDGGRPGRGGPRQLPNLPDPDADEAYLLALGVL